MDDGHASRLFSHFDTGQHLRLVYVSDMANKSLFASTKSVPRTDTVNSAGGLAYTLPAKQALAQYAATGCLSNTFYASATEQLDKVLALTEQVDATFLAKTAIYTRQKSKMKDMPALLMAVLSKRDPALTRAVFPRVINDARMVRNFVQIIRSGTTGRKSLGTMLKSLITDWFNSRDDQGLFFSNIGNDPSLADVIRLTHPKPATPSRKAMYGYLLGKEHDKTLLPMIVSQFEAFKAGSGEMPLLPYLMLSSMNLTPAQWVVLAAEASWQTTRMNLNTFARHGVFSNPAMVQMVAARLRDPEAIKISKAFPYQLLAAFNNVDDAVPVQIKNALQDAMEISVANVPAIQGQVYVLIDVSGSMRDPVTGTRQGATSKMRCIDVAALMASAILKKNDSAKVIAFNSSVCKVDLNPRDSVMTNTAKLAAMANGGTDCGAPMRELNATRAVGDTIVFLSDNQSWLGRGSQQTTGVMDQWRMYRTRSPYARMVCIDTTPNSAVQAAESKDIMNIGGFSDAVFDLVAAFTSGDMGENKWVGVIDSIDL